MKRKENQNPKTENRQRHRRNDSEFSTLNDSLGSFGLEPPKRRTEQRNPAEEIQKRVTRKREPQNRTRNEIRMEEDKKRKSAKLRRKVLSYVVLVVAIAAVIVVLSLTVLFNISKITINGNNKYTNQEITAVLPIETGKNLFTCDTKGAAEKLEENLPYIYKAQIVRKFPSTIVVNITETPIVYSVENADKTYTLLDGNFKVLEVSAKKKKNAVSINKVTFKTAVPGQVAEFTDEKLKDNLSKLTGVVTDLKLDKVTGISSKDVNNNYLIYDKRITIKLGSTDNLEDKIYSALTVIEKLDESNPQAEGIITVGNDKQVYFTEK